MAKKKVEQTATIDSNFKFNNPSKKSVKNTNNYSFSKFIFNIVAGCK